MTKSDWINAAVAIGVAATAVFTAMTAFASRRQTQLLLPVVHCSAQRQGAYAALYAGLDDIDKERHFIAKITALRPWRARLIRPDWRQDALGQPVPVPPNGRWRRSLSFDGPVARPPIAIIDPAGSPSVKLRFNITLRADSSAVSRFTTRIKIQD
jgi:hypothetical protein